LDYLPFEVLLLVELFYHFSIIFVSKLFAFSQLGAFPINPNISYLFKLFRLDTYLFLDLYKAYSILIGGLNPLVEVVNGGKKGSLETPLFF